MRSSSAGVLIVHLHNNILEPEKLISSQKKVAVTKLVKTLKSMINQFRTLISRVFWC